MNLLPLLVPLLLVPTVIAQTPRPAQNETSIPSQPEKPVAEQLSAAKRELVVLRMRHPERHPLVVRQKGTVAKLEQALRDETASRPKPDRAKQLEMARSELKDMLERYTDQHPSVIHQRRRIAELEASAPR